MPLESYSTADILLTERRRLEKPMLLLVWLGAAAFSLEEGNVLYLLASTLGVAANYLAVKQNKEIYVRRFFVNIGVALATGVIVLERLFTNLPLLLTVGHFMILIQLCKLFERKRNRDYVQLMILSMLLLVSTALISRSMWFAPIFILYLALAGYVAMVFTLKRGLDTAAAVTLRGETGPLSPRRVAWNVVRDWPTRPLRRIVWVLLLPSLVMGVLAFLFVPRGSEDIFDALGQQLMATGYDSSIRLGSRKEIYLSDRLVMRVRIIENGRPGTAGSLTSQYLRRNVLDEYAASTWRQSAGSERFRTAPAIETTLPDPVAVNRVRHEFLVLPLGRVETVSPYWTFQLTGPAGSKVRVSPALEYELTGSFRHSETLEYATESLPPPLTEAQSNWLKTQTPLGTEALLPPRRRVRLPAQAEQRIAILAQQWCGDLLAKRAELPGDQRASLNLDIAQRITNRLQQQYDYTLDLTASNPDIDGVADFLFNLRAGHCEYFASTLAVMCCILDVPARVATGFLISEYDVEEQLYIVRERDAHAWCEVADATGQWRLIDPTPAGERIESFQDSWWTPMRDWLQEMQMTWYRNVVGYDLDTQRDIRRRVVDQMVDRRKQLREVLNDLKASFFKLLTEGSVDQILVQFLLSIQVITIGVIVLLVVRRIRQARTARADPALNRRLTPLEKILDTLQREGLRFEPSSTLYERVALALKRFDLPARPLRELVRLQYRWRWGGVKPTDGEMEQTRRHYRQIMQSLQARRKT